MRSGPVVAAGLCAALLLGGCSAPAADATYRWERPKTEEELEAENKAAEKEVIEQYFEDGLPTKFDYVFTSLKDCGDAAGDGDAATAGKTCARIKATVDGYLEEEAPCESVSSLHEMAKNALEEMALAADDLYHASYSSDSYWGSASEHVENSTYWIDSCTEEAKRLKTEYGIGGE